MKAFKDYLAEAMRLRALWSDTATDFFAFLMTWEADEKAWKSGGGWTTYAEVLNASNICKPHRFAKFKASLELAGGSIDAIRKLGPDGWEELLKIPCDAKSRQDGSVSAVQAVLKDAGEFRERLIETVSRAPDAVYQRGTVNLLEGEMADAMTDVDQAAHDHTVTRIFPRIAETGSTADVLALLAAHGA